MVQPSVRICSLVLVLTVACSGYVAAPGAVVDATDDASSSTSSSGGASSSGHATTAGRCATDDEGHLAYPEGLDDQGFRCVGGCETANGRVWCTGLDPFGPATEDDLRPGQVSLGELELGRPYATSAVRGTWLDPSTGRIVERRTDGAGGEHQVEVRPANADPRVEAVHAGVAFRILADGRAMWRARNVRIYEGMSFVDDVATLPVALLAEQIVAVRGRVRVPCGRRGEAPTEGSGEAGLRASANQGFPDFYLAAGGGNGSAGGGRNAQEATAGGERVAWTEDRLPLGGHGGAASAQSLDLPTAGGGGAALQLIAGMRIEVLGSGGVNVGGCGGRFASPSDHVPGGGGAGGTLLLEAPTIALAPGATLVAHGGGGGWVVDYRVGGGTEVDGAWSTAPLCPPTATDPSHLLHERAGCAGIDEAGGSGQRAGANWTAGGGGHGHIVLRAGHEPTITEEVLISPRPLLKLVGDE